MITTEEFLQKRELYHPDIKEALIEFAKLHATEALKQAAEEATIETIGWGVTIDKESILSAYPLELIK